MPTPECLLVSLVVDNCTQTVLDTTDMGPVSGVLNFGSAACVAAGVTAAITPCSATAPGNLVLSCSIANPACTVLGASPVPGDPAFSNVLFQLTWDETVTGTIGISTCTVTRTGITQDILVQLTTSTIAQPLTYTCTLLSTPACYSALVFETADSTCHLVVNAAFCVAFESITTVTRLISTDPCVPVACDPLPVLECPPSS